MSRTKGAKCRGKRRSINRLSPFHGIMARKAASRDALRDTLFQLGRDRALQDQETFLAHLDGATPGSIEIDDEVDDQDDKHHQHKCPERWSMPRNS